VGRGANLLLNVPPDKTGRIPQDYVDALVELKRVIDDPALLAQLPKPDSLAFGCPAKASSVWGRHPQWAAANAVDDDPCTYWRARQGMKQAWLEVDLGKPTTFDRVRIIEGGNRIRKYELQAKRGDAWETFATGKTIGKTAELRFESLTARQVRLNILEATDSPMICEFELFTPSGGN
jgi:alpha-L-fucosidase